MAQAQHTYRTECNFRSQQYQESAVRSAVFISCQSVDFQGHQRRLRCEGDVLLDANGQLRVELWVSHEVWDVSLGPEEP